MRSMLVTGDARIRMPVDLGYRVSATVDGIEDSYLIGKAEWHRQMAAVKSRTFICYHDEKKHCWCLNSRPSGGRPPKDEEGYNWQEIVKVIKEVKGWSYKALDAAVGAGEGSSSGWARKQWKPRQAATRLRLLDLAKECGVLDVDEKMREVVA